MPEPQRPGDPPSPPADTPPPDEAARRAARAAAIRAYLLRVRRVYGQTLAVLLVFLLSMTGAYVAINHTRIFPAPGHVVVYGNDRCGFTSRMRRQLAAAGIDFEYGDLDLVFPEYEVSAHLHLTTARAVRLPVVLVGGKVLERPTFEEVAALQAGAR